MSLSPIGIKRGDTLSMAGYLPLGALPEGSWSARCAIESRGTGQRHVIGAILVPPSVGEARWMLHLYASSAVTGKWLPGKYLGDVEFTDASALPTPFTVSSRDFALTVLPDRTAS